MPERCKGNRNIKNIIYFVVDSVTELHEQYMGIN